MATKTFTHGQTGKTYSSKTAYRRDEARLRKLRCSKTNMLDVAEGYGATNVMYFHVGVFYVVIGADASGDGFTAYVARNGRFYGITKADAMNGKAARASVAGLKKAHLFLDGHITEMNARIIAAGLKR